MKCLEHGINDCFCLYGHLTTWAITSERVAPASERSPDVEQQAQEDDVQLHVIVERINGKRTAKAWLEAVVAGVEPDDVEL